MIIILENNFKNEISEYMEKVLNKEICKNVLVENLEASQNYISKNIDICLIYNLDDKIIHKAVKDFLCKKISFAINEQADFIASDINDNDETINFKLNYKGNCVPIRIKKRASKNVLEIIYCVLPVIVAGDLLGINVVEVSENLKQ